MQIGDNSLPGCNQGLLYELILGSCQHAIVYLCTTKSVALISVVLFHVEKFNYYTEQNKFYKHKGQSQ